MGARGDNVSWLKRGVMNDCGSFGGLRLGTFTLCIQFGDF